MGGQVDGDGALPGGQLFQQRRDVGATGDGAHPTQSRQQRLQFLPGEEVGAETVALGDGDAAAIALGGHQGDARPAKVLHIPADGAAGDLEPGGQFRGGGAALARA